MMRRSHLLMTSPTIHQLDKLIEREFNRINHLLDKFGRRYFYFNEVIGELDNIYAIGLNLSLDPFVLSTKYKFEEEHNPHAVGALIEIPTPYIITQNYKRKREVFCKESQKVLLEDFVIQYGDDKEPNWKKTLEEWNSKQNDPSKILIAYHEYPGRPTVQ